MTALWRAASPPNLSERILQLLHDRLLRGARTTHISAESIAERLDATLEDTLAALRALTQAGKVTEIPAVWECSSCGALFPSPAEHNAVGSVRCPAGADGFDLVPATQTTMAATIQRGYLPPEIAFLTTPGRSCKQRDENNRECGAEAAIVVFFRRFDGVHQMGRVCEAHLQDLVREHPPTGNWPVIGAWRTPDDDRARRLQLGLEVDAGASIPLSARERSERR